jgi:hypothetical protein
MTAAPRESGHDVQGDPAMGSLQIPRETPATKSAEPPPQTCFTCGEKALVLCRCGNAACLDHLYDSDGSRAITADKAVDGWCGQCMEEIQMLQWWENRHA